MREQIRANVTAPARRLLILRSLIRTETWSTLLLHSPAGQQESQAAAAEAMEAATVRGRTEIGRMSDRWRIRHQ